MVYRVLGIRKSCLGLDTENMTDTAKCQSHPQSEESTAREKAGEMTDVFGDPLRLFFGGASHNLFSSVHAITNISLVHDIVWMVGLRSSPPLSTSSVCDDLPLLGSSVRDIWPI
ncbi:hypothetical protein TNCV_3051581 [Trichonephila clavipes]|nr:hypothetical protein TNCV_3051581 [Trichonephila clavipes]